MRHFAPLIAAVLLMHPESSFAQGTSTTAKPTPTFWAYQFVDSVGTNIHLHNSQGIYRTQFELIKQKLLAARIKHVRDGAHDLNGTFHANDSAARFAELGRAGIKVTFIFRPNVTKEFVQGWPARVNPAFEAYELPNELNSQKTTPWVETLQTWTPTFSQWIRSNAATAAYPIIGPSLIDLGDEPNGPLGSLATHIDYGNLHKYYPGYAPSSQGWGRRAQPPCEAFRYGSLGYAMCHIAKVAGSKPIICTETGYGTNTAINRQVTPAIQAKYISRSLMLHLKVGIPRTFIYQLADYGTDTFQDYGLLTQTAEDKPSYIELRGLMNELDDKPGTGSAAVLPISITGDSGDVESALFAKTDGSYRLVLWIEKPGYDPTANGGAGAVVTVPPQNVTVSFPDSHAVRRIVRFEESGALNVKEIAAATPLQLTLSDNLAIVDLGKYIPPARPKAPVIDRPL